MELLLVITLSRTDEPVSDFLLYFADGLIFKPVLDDATSDLAQGTNLWINLLDGMDNLGEGVMQGAVVTTGEEKLITLAGRKGDSTMAQVVF